MTGSAMHHMV